MSVIVEYNRRRAVDYANRWAFSRNPAYLDYSDLGGDCTSYVSQCLYAGSGVMNYTPVYGWYYIDGNDKSPSWSGVEFLYNFLVGNRQRGPFAVVTDENRVEIGDVIQLQNSAGNFYHTLIITRISRGRIYVNSHSNDARRRPLSLYNYAGVRFLHIMGVYV